ncbi:MAG: hypothetical protein R3208_04465 [Ketobacteraceae bacterium]|nr:hypothetical protein [Ketobacteraceae bacterium]
MKYRNVRPVGEEVGISASELKEYVVRPTLRELGVWSPAMEALLLGTAAQASQFGFHIKKGRGLGIFSIDSGTHREVWDNFLAFDPDKASYIRGTASQREFLKEPDHELITNLVYATAIAWGVYASQEVELPEEASDVQALAQIWHNLYPRQDTTATPADFVENYRKYVSSGPKLVA